MRTTDPLAVHGHSDAADGVKGFAGTETANLKTPAPAVRSRLWIWFVVAFAVQFAVWIGLFVFAAHHRVEEVPLATTSTR